MTTSSAAGDKRFTFGLVYDVARKLEEHGYDEFTGQQLVELQQALFRFLYRPKS